MKGSTPMSEEELRQSLSKVEFWRRVAALTFSTLAAITSVAATYIGSAFIRLSEKFDEYVLSMEKRTILLEERQGRILKVLEDQDSRLDDMERRQQRQIPQYGIAPDRSDERFKRSGK